MKLLIAGAFGYGNLGDNAVRDAELAFAASRGLTATWAAPADYPVDGYDAVAVGGGGILYDADYENIANYCRYVEAAKLAGKKAAFVNVGTQGFRTPRGRARMASALKAVDAISVRDPEDAIVLKALGAKDIFVAEDSAWALNYPTARSCRAAGFAWRSFSALGFDGAKYLAGAKQVADTFGASFYVTSKEDIAGLQAQGCHFTTAATLEELAGKYDSTIVACTRFHGVVSAISAGVEPIVCYRGAKDDGKCARIMHRLGLRGVDIESRGWPKVLEDLFKQGPIKRDWQGLAAVMKKKAADGMEFAFSVLKD